MADVQIPTDYEGNPEGSYTPDVGSISSATPSLAPPDPASEFQQVLAQVQGYLHPRDNIDQATPTERAAAAAKMPSAVPVAGAAPVQMQQHTPLISQLIQALAGKTAEGTANATQSANTTAQADMAAAQQASQSTNKSSGGSSGGGLGNLLSTAASVIGWIICTELMRQGKMPRKYWFVGSKVFAAYPEAVKQGYYLWAIPSVKHLRRSPNSAYSQFLSYIFNLRAENIAYYAGVDGARKRMAGALVTIILWPICYLLGLFVMAFSLKLNWKGLYQ